MAAGSFTNSAKGQYAGLGSYSDYQSADFALTGTATKTLTTSLAGACKGMVRCKWSGPNAATTIQVLITVTDGTTTVEIGTVDTTQAGNSMDFIKEFVVDITITTISFICTLGGATTTGTLDIEALIGN